MLYIGDNKIIKGYIGDIPVTHVSFGNRALIKLEVFIEKRFTPKCTDFSVKPRSTIIIEYTSEGISKNDITVTYDEAFFTRNGDSFTLIAEGYSEIIYSVKGLSSVIIRVATSEDSKYYATQIESSTIYTSPGRNFTLSDGVTLIPSNANEELSYSFDSPYAYQRNFETFLLMGQGNFTAKYQGKYVSGDIQINSGIGDSQLVLICKSIDLVGSMAVHSVQGASDDWWVTIQNYGDNVNTLIATATVFPTSFKLGDTYNARYLAKVDYLHTKNLTDMNWMFYGCSNLESINFVGNASKVTNLNYTFGSCSKLTSLDLNSWDTSCVSNMSSTFNSCQALSSLDIGQWNTSVVNDMSDMFNYCRSLTSLDLSSWDFSNVINTSYMFGDCTNLYDLYINNYNDSWSISNMCGMFYYCSSLSSIDLSYWYTYNLQDTSYMFYGCSNLYELYLNNFDMTQVYNTDEMFGDCSNLQVLHLDYCSYETVEKIITSSNFPEWNSGTIYCSYDVYSSLTPPGSWTFEPVW